MGTTSSHARAQLPFDARVLTRGASADVPELAFGVPEEPIRGLFLVAPDEREGEVRAQLRRPAFQRIQHLEVRYLPYGELEKNREQMARFGSGLRPIDAIARRLT